MFSCNEHAFTHVANLCVGYFHYMRVTRIDVSFKLWMVAKCTVSKNMNMYVTP